VTTEMHCHNVACELYGETQLVRVYPASMSGPADWMDEPVCERCHWELQYDVHDVQTELVKAYEKLPLDVRDWDEEDLEFFRSAEAYNLGRRGRRMGDAL
jgi:hypothetical protein